MHNKETTYILMFDYDNEKFEDITKSQFYNPANIVNSALINHEKTNCTNLHIYEEITLSPECKCTVVEGEIDPQIVHFLNERDTYFSTHITVFREEKDVDTTTETDTRTE